METKHRWNLGYWVLALALLMFAQTLWQGATRTETVPYSEIERALAEGRIAQIVVSDRLITARLKQPDGQTTQLSATRVEPDLAARLEKFDVPYSRVVDNTFVRDLLSWIAPAAIFIGLWLFVFRRFAEKQGMGSFMSIGRSRAKVYVVSDTG